MIEEIREGEKRVRREQTQGVGNKLDRGRETVGGKEG